jgi:hypothetical protein
LKGPSIASDFWPDPVVSEAARVETGDGTPAAAVREAGRRRKRLQGAAQGFKAQVKLVWTNILAEENDERRAGLHQRMRLALHEVAVCLLLLGLGKEAGMYLRRAQRDWTMSQTLSSDPTYSLYAPGWAMLPAFSRFVSRDNNVRLLRRMYGACEASDVKKRRKLGLGLLTEIDAKIVEGELFLCPFDVVVVLYEAWVTSQSWQYEFVDVRQKHYCARAKLVCAGEAAGAFTPAQAVEVEAMHVHMLAGDEIWGLRHRPDGCKILRWCQNTACPRDRWGAANAVSKSCQKCDSGYYCSQACQVAHWPVHKQVCKRLLLVGKTVRTTWNADVLRARNSVELMGALVGVLRVRVDVGQQDLKHMLAARELLSSPEAQHRSLIRRMRDQITHVNEWTVSLAQALLFQGRTDKAYGVYVEGCEMRNMCANIPGDEEGVIATVIASAQMDREFLVLGKEVGYYVGEQVLARLLQRRSETEAGGTGILLYVAIFDVTQRQIEFCQENGMLAREFYARYLLWREGYRYAEEYAELAELHYYNEVDESRIQQVVDGLESAHEAADLLCRAFANSERMDRMQEEERMVAIDMRFKLLCMQGVYDLPLGEVSRVKV